ncbi:hypothetical protein TcasGA2_TC006895 [Tribolium castaneum]|uniref:Uncharacterized protein n=1 Tax=Tribolium castaneum TaxID=7070 RepID=D7EII2_TRICA|nr:PREDICTED: uncharacterized protein LOC103312837 [Tribolium castaneum]EFA12005.2 hypothetical protein TcasGA2_TC006895 [Tribolium castaneum]|eukprot:XP_008192735.1 PREDICTED: uncharacterized protein LOC103312837 [Tribolium castaneum]
MSFLRIGSSKRYNVTNSPPPFHLRALHAPVIAELKQLHTTPQQFDLKVRLEFLKSQARTIERQIVSDLRQVHNLHRQEIALLRDEFRTRNLTFQRDLEHYFRQQKSHIESVVYKYAVEMLELDPSSGKEIEKLMKRMMDELGVEAEEVVWGGKRRKWWACGCF